MADKCPFCGSEKTIINTPYVELGRSGKYETKTTFCCKSQRQNAQYISKRFGKDPSNQKEMKEVSKW